MPLKEERISLQHHCIVVEERTLAAPICGKGRHRSARDYYSELRERVWKQQPRKKTTLKVLSGRNSTGIAAPCGTKCTRYRSRESEALGQADG